mgnify:CR=1 FL=1
MTTAPKNPFNLHAAKDTNTLRDKDNADNKMPPPKHSRKPAPNLAPKGAGGIRRGLSSSGGGAKEPEPLTFTLGEKGKLAKEFKSLAKPGESHDHEH